MALKFFPNSADTKAAIYHSLFRINEAPPEVKMNCQILSLSRLSNVRKVLRLIQFTSPLLLAFSFSCTKSPSIDKPSPKVEGAQDKKKEYDPNDDSGNPAGNFLPGSTEDHNGLTPDEFEKGRSYVNGWLGALDEAAASQLWTLIDLPDAAVLPPAVVSPVAGIPAAGPVTYLAQVKAILDRSCVSCHSTTGTRSNSPMDSFAAAKQGGVQLVQRTVAGTMPQSGPLSEADKAVLTAWQAGGFLEGNSGGEVPSPSPSVTSGPSDESASEVVFHIKNGTGRGPWNSAATIVTAKVGKTFTIVNDDTVVHQWHTNGSPCPHGSPIAPGASESCQPREPYSEGGLYDHISRAAFYFQAQ